MSKKKFVLLAAAATVIIIIACLMLNKGDRQAAAITLYGNVELRQVSLAFEAQGRVTALAAEEGDQISAGQLLAELDTTALRKQLALLDARQAAQQQALKLLENGPRPAEREQARAHMQAAQAQAQLAQTQYARVEQAHRQSQGKAASASELDSARTQQQVAQAQARAAEQQYRLLEEGSRPEQIAQGRAQLRAVAAEIDLLQHQISLGALHAPVDGVVRSRLVEVGDMVAPQKNAFTLAITTPKWVRAYVDGVQLGQVAEGMSALVYNDSQPQPITGRVSFISQVAEFTPKQVQTEQLRTSLVYELRVTVDDPDNTLRLGQPVTVSLGQ